MGVPRQNHPMNDRPALNPHDAQQLVSLRLALEAALLQVRSARAYRRGAAIVALDATVERAANLCASARGIPVAAKLEDTISRLRNDGDFDWRPTVLPDIRLLRKARNAAQHDGLEPDRDALPGWARAAELFVIGVVEAQFDVDVRHVVLSSAIADLELRRSVELAEEAHVSKDFGACIENVDEAYATALAKWRRIRPRRSDPFARDRLDQAAHDGIAHLERALDAAAFVGDVGAAEWFSALRQERDRDVFDEDDATRALAFVFAWVTGYESAHATWTYDRNRRADLAARRVRAENQPASIASVEVREAGRGSIETTFVLADVPPAEEFDEWASALQAQFRSVPDGYWQVRGNGTVRVLRSAPDTAASVADVDTLATALRNVDEHVRQQRRAVEERAALLAASTEALRASAAAIRADWPSWIDDITGGHDHQFGDVWLVTLPPSIDLLNLSEDEQARPYDNDVATLLRNMSEIDQCWHTGNGPTLGISPSMPANELVRVLRSADAQISVAVERRERATEDRRRLLTDTRAAVAAAVSRSQINSSGPRGS